MFTARAERRCAAAALGLVLVSAAPGSARAQSGATAQALFEEGQALFARERFSEACEKFAASQRVEGATGTLLNLGRCYARVQRNASAWVAFREAETRANRENDPRREQAARNQAHALDAQLARLEIDVPSPAPGLVVTRDGVAVDPGAFGVVVPLDAGTHRLEARAPGREDFRQDIVARDGASQTVTIPALAPAPAPAPSPVVIVTPAAAPEPARTRRDPGYRTAGVVVAGVGVAGAAVGTVFGVRALGKWHSSEAECNAAHQCTTQGQSDAATARSSADISTASFIVAGVALAVGAAFYFLAPERPEAPRAAFTPVPSADGLAFPFD